MFCGLCINYGVTTLLLQFGITILEIQPCSVVKLVNDDSVVYFCYTKSAKNIENMIKIKNLNIKINKKLHFFV